MTALFDQFDVALPGDSPEKTYVGHRTGVAPTNLRGRAVVFIIQGTKEHPLPIEGRHSPDGVEWGYSGSGPSELALAIMRDHLDCDPPPAVYQSFKTAVIAHLPHDGWQLCASEIAAWLGRNLRGSRG